MCAPLAGESIPISDSGGGVACKGLDQGTWTGLCLKMRAPQIANEPEGLSIPIENMDNRLAFTFVLTSVNARQIVHEPAPSVDNRAVESSLLVYVDPSFQALSGRHKLPFRRHTFNKDSLILHGRLCTSPRRRSATTPRRSLSRVIVNNPVIKNHPV